MLTQYETVFILTPVLSEDDTKKTINGYLDLLKSKGAEIVHQEAWGLRNLRLVKIAFCFGLRLSIGVISKRSDRATFPDFVLRLEQGE